MAKGVEIPGRYRAFLMEQLVNGTDPTALEKNLHSSLRFFCPWMTEKKRKKTVSRSASDTDTEPADLSARDTDSDSDNEEQAADAKKGAAARVQMSTRSPRHAPCGDCAR